MEKKTHAQSRTSQQKQMNPITESCNCRHGESAGIIPDPGVELGSEEWNGGFGFAEWPIVS